MANNVTDGLRALATGKGRSEAARLRDIFGDVEDALRAGASREAVYETLQRCCGFTMNFKSFIKTLYRIRKQRKCAGLHNVPVSPATPQGFGYAPREPAAVSASNTKPVVPDDLSALSPKARRDRLADKFIRPDNTNPLFKRFNKEN